jgi:hypothetical protein
MLFGAIQLLVRMTERARDAFCNGGEA